MQNLVQKVSKQDFFCKFWNLIFIPVFSSLFIWIFPEKDNSHYKLTGNPEYVHSSHTHVS